MVTFAFFYIKVFFYIKYVILHLLYLVNQSIAILNSYGFIDIFNLIKPKLKYTSYLQLMSNIFYFSY